jgi:hypothetical protein
MEDVILRVPVSYLCGFPQLILLKILLTFTCFEVLLQKVELKMN